MAAQRQELIPQQFNFVPTTLKEAQEYATIFANSGLCPETYRGRPNDILIVWQLGKELGLDKMQALRTLGCINGMPFAYGDGQLALIKRHPDFEDMKEWFEGSIDKGNLTAFCTMKRKNQAPITQSFSMEDAKLANLWSKKGVWQLYPKRMLQHRARGFCAKDAFPDALYGLMSEEEVRSVQASQPNEPVVIKGKGLKGLEDTLGINDSEIIEAEIVEENTEAEVILEANNRLDELKNLLVEKQVSQKTIDLWLKKAKVSNIDEFSDSNIEQAINFLKKEIK